MSKYSRIEKGLEIAKSGRVQPCNEKIKKYTVLGDTGNIYLVTYNMASNEWTCECHDFEHSGLDKCKHIHAVKFYREAGC